MVTAVGKGTLDARRSPPRRYADAPDPRLVVVQGIAKGDRGELAVQAMTEVGVDEIVPWAAARSVAQWRATGAPARDSGWPPPGRRPSRPAGPGCRRSAARRTRDSRRGAPAGRRRGGVRAARGGRPSGCPRSTLPAGGEIVLVVGPEGGIDAGRAGRVRGGRRGRRSGWATRCCAPRPPGRRRWRRCRSAPRAAGEPAP